VNTTKYGYLSLPDATKLIESSLKYNEIYEKAVEVNEVKDPSPTVFNSLLWKGIVRLSFECPQIGDTILVEVAPLYQCYELLGSEPFYELRNVCSRQGVKYKEIKSFQENKEADNIMKKIIEKKIEEANPQVQSFAQKSGKTIGEVETLWSKAKEVVTKQYKDVAKDSEQYYQLVVGVLKKMLSIDEGAEDMYPMDEQNQQKEYVAIDNSDKEPIAIANIKIPLEIGQIFYDENGKEMVTTAGDYILGVIAE